MPWLDWRKGLLFPDLKVKAIAAFLAGPWYWPPDEERCALVRRELDITMPPPRVGQVPVVAVSDKPVDTGYLWVLDHHAGTTCHFNECARGAWESALNALTDAVEVLWKSPETLRGKLPHAHRIAEWTSRCGPPRKVYMLDGGSFGLSFLVSQVSELTDVVPRADTIASAEITSGGGVASVDLEGLRVKIETVIDQAPSIQRFLVHHEQEREANAIAGGKLTIVGVHSLREGLEEAFEWPLTKLLVELGSDQRRRSEVVNSLFAAATGSIAVPPRAWRPFIEATTVAADWSAIDASEKYKLDYARAFAERHETNEVSSPPPWPIPGSLKIPPEQVAAVFANLIQQSYDCGFPTAHELLGCLEDRMPMPKAVRDHFPHQLKIAGALWRLQAKEGKLEDACAAQADLAEEWIHRGEAEEATRPLSEAYRLSAFLSDEAAFKRLEALRTNASAVMASPYVSLNRGRALLAFSEPTVTSVLELVANDDNAPPHVRYSAGRLLARTGIRDSKLHEEMARVADVAAQANPDDRNAAQMFLALEELDRVLASTGKAEAETEVLARLEALEPSLVSALLKLAAARRWPAGRTVSDGFPY